jgi:hypothetical protein
LRRLLERRLTPFGADPFGRARATFAGLLGHLRSLLPPAPRARARVSRRRDRTSPFCLPWPKSDGSARFCARFSAFTRFQP